MRRHLNSLGDGGALLDDEAVVFDCRGLADRRTDLGLEVVWREAGGRARGRHKRVREG